MTVHSKLREALPYLPLQMQQALSRIPSAQSSCIQEIRLRINHQMQAVSSGKAYTVSADGSLLPLSSSGVPVTRQALDTVFRNICAHSLHSWQEAIRQGFITIAGGCRVGLCGTAVLHDGALETVRAVSGMNIRIASERIGCAETLCTQLPINRLREGILIAGAPASGKTTMLRDIARILGASHRVCIIDSRGELAAVRNGLPQFDLGLQTDVLDGYPKPAGTEIAVRVMSPEILICDELGSAAETEVLLESLRTGVAIVASAHAGSLQELHGRPQIAALIEAGAFRTGVLLGSGRQCGQVISVSPLQRPAA